MVVANLLQRSFFATLSKTSKVAFPIYLCVHAFFLLYYAANLPTHYDEWFSYRNFSSLPVSKIVSFYPSSNNHVFYNLIAHFFVMPNCHVATAMRLPAVLAELLSIYLLFKLCKSQVSEVAAWLVVLLYSTSYNVILYAVEARGYAFLNLFTVLLIGATINFGKAGATSKQIVKLGFVQALGLFTVPTFIYAVVPVYLYLFLQGLFTNQKNSLLKVLALALFSVATTALLYLPILLSENVEVLLHSNTSEGKFNINEVGVFDSILYYLNKMYYEVLGLAHPWWLAAAFGSLLVVAYLIKSKAQNMFQLSLLMLLSPILLLLVHHYFAYGRNWFFLCIPASLLIALPVLLLENAGASKMDLQSKMRSFLTLLLVPLLLVSIYRSLKFTDKHKLEYSLDYDIAAVLNICPDVRSIARTDGMFEFYPADVLQAEYEQLSKGAAVPVSSLSAEAQQDLLLISADKLAAQKIDGKVYKFCFYSHNIFFYKKIKP